MKDYFFIRQKIEQERFKVTAETEQEAWDKLSVGDYKEVRPTAPTYVKAPVLVRATKVGAENE